MFKLESFYTPSNLQALNESLLQLKNGDVVVKTTEELEKMAEDKDIDANTLALIESEIITNDPNRKHYDNFEEIIEELDSE